MAVKVTIRLEEDDQTLEITDRICNDAYAVEVLVSKAYSLWNATRQESFT